MPRTKDEFGGAFDRVWVDYALTGITRVSWELRWDFLKRPPFLFQLQANRNWDEPDDWEDVGLPVTDTYFALDDQQREYGKGQRVGYRVKMTVDGEEYISKPAQVYGNLSKREWLLARAIIRRALLTPRQRYEFNGSLLKRKIHGEICTDCVDPITGGIMNSDCPECNGTGRIDGYWNARELIIYDLGPEGDDTKRSQRGTVNEQITVGQCVGIPPIMRNDVWVEDQGDRRYVVNRVVTKAEMGRVPLIVQAELRLVEYGDVLYDIDVESP